MTLQELAEITIRECKEQSRLHREQAEKHQALAKEFDERLAVWQAALDAEKHQPEKG